MKRRCGIWHWVNALAIVVLATTGYFIASPLPSTPGEASANFLMGYIRFAHFAVGLCSGGRSCSARIYWAFVGNAYARQIFYVAALGPQSGSGACCYELRWYLFLVKRPQKYVGHNPLAQLSMFSASRCC